MTRGAALWFSHHQQGRMAPEQPLSVAACINEDSWVFNRLLDSIQLQKWDGANLFEPVAQLRICQHQAPVLEITSPCIQMP